MLAYAVNDCGYDTDTFFGGLIMCGLADPFVNGDPKYIAGLSGIELAREAVYQTSGVRPSTEATQDIEKDATHWAGWALAHYQCFSGLRFSDIIRGGLTVSKVNRRMISEYICILKALFLIQN